MHNLKKIHIGKKKVWYVILVLCVGLITSVYYLIPSMFADEVYPLKYADYIKTYSVKYNVDPALVAAVILQESRFNPNANSGVGAQGLMQFMPGTAATMAKETGRWPKYNIYDPETSVEFGAAHLRDLLNKYNGNEQEALTAYNEGTGTVDSWIRRNVFTLFINNNYTYAEKVMNYQTVYRTMYPKELGITTPGIKIQQADPATTKAQVRGFVWTEIFSKYFGL